MADAMPAATTPNKTWVRRIAEELAKESEHVSFTPEFIEAVLEAAGELKAVRCKVMLARCYETIRTSRITDVAADSTEKFELAILELC